MTKYYRAKITLEEITPLSTPDSQTYENVRASELAEVTITAETPSAAMTQAANLAHQIVTTRARPAYRRQTAPEGGVAGGAQHYVAPAEPWDAHAPVMEAKKASWAEAITPEPASDQEAFAPKEPEKQ